MDYGLDEGFGEVPGTGIGKIFRIFEIIELFDLKIERGSMFVGGVCDVGRAVEIIFWEVF